MKSGVCTDPRKAKYYRLLPNIDTFAHNNSFIHEYIGYCGYKWFR